LSDTLRKSKQALGRSLGYLGLTRRNLQIAKLRKKYWAAAPGSTVEYGGYRIRITDGPSFYIQIKDEFIHQIYHFETDVEAPLIIDGGGNIGVSVLYFKRVYPKARIICFEPDPEIFAILQENLAANNLNDVTLINAGLGAQEGTANFAADHSAGGRVTQAANSTTVKIQTLSSSIDEPIDFLKLNIEGEELPVLRELESADRLHRIKQLVLEYHGWANEEQRLGPILDLLDRNGFKYLVHDFDSETGYATKPPFMTEPQRTWFCLVYARNQRPH
jgi:FkbM family methyltransferase